MTLLLASGCSKYDDSALNGRVGDLENRVDQLEEQCKQMNTDISSLQTLVEAIQGYDYVTGVTPVTQDGKEIGYTITFTKRSAPIRSITERTGRMERPARMDRTAILRKSVSNRIPTAFTTGHWTVMDD